MELSPSLILRDTSELQKEKTWHCPKNRYTDQWNGNKGERRGEEEKGREGKGKVSQGKSRGGGMGGGKKELSNAVKILTVLKVTKYSKLFKAT